MSDVLVLAADDIRVDYHRSVQAPDGTLVVELEAAAEMTRYHCLMVRRTDGQWFVMCENLELALPLLPTLGGWHWSYIQGKLRDNGRTSMAMTLLMQHVHDTVQI